MQYKTTKNVFSRGVRRLLIRINPNRKYKDALFRFIFKDKKKLLSLYNALNNSQYTWNPNMPIRGLIYLAARYEEMIRRQDLDIYGRSLVNHLKMPWSLLLIIVSIMIFWLISYLRAAGR